MKEFYSYNYGLGNVVFFFFFWEVFLIKVTSMREKTKLRRHLWLQIKFISCLGQTRRNNSETKRSCFRVSNIEWYSISEVNKISRIMDIWFNRCFNCFETTQKINYVEFFYVFVQWRKYIELATKCVTPMETSVYI